MRRRTFSSKGDIQLKNSPSANSGRISSPNTSSISIPIYTRHKRKEIGPTLPKGSYILIQVVQLRRRPQGTRIRLPRSQCLNIMENLCQQKHGLVASPHCPPHLHCGSPFVTILLSRLLQKHHKKLFDMCNLGEEYHLGNKRN